MSGALAAVAGNSVGAINQSLPNGTQIVSSVWQLNNDGTYTIAGVSDANWVTPASAPIAALYQVKVDVTSGSFTAGDTTGSFLDLSTTRGWAKTGAGTVEFTVTIREKASTTVRTVQAGHTLITT